MMHEVYTPNVLAASIGEDADVIMEKRKELYQKRELNMSMKLRKDQEKMKKQDSFTVKVGMIIPDRTGEQQIQQQSQWWEEEMRRREQLIAQQAEKEAQYQAELNELKQTEEKLENLQTQWQAKVDEIHLEEDALATIVKEFEDKVNLELRGRVDQASASSSSVGTSHTTRMQEEAARRAAKKALREGSGNPEQEARAKLFVDIESKNGLEREIARVQKDVGLMKQRIRLKEKSREQIMDSERKRRIESDPRELPSLEVLYAPKYVPPRPVIVQSHVSRMEEAKREREARRAARLNSNNNNSITIDPNAASSSKLPGTAKN